MRYKNLIINIPVYTEIHSTFPKPIDENYNYWTSLLEFFLKKSDTVEIHCWNEETETIDEITSLFNREIEVVKEESLTIFKGTTSKLLVDYLLKKNVNKNGELKWFTLNLVKSTVPVFHSGHWGTELYIPNSTEEIIAFVKNVIPKETIFHAY